MVAQFSQYFCYSWIYTFSSKCWEQNIVNWVYFLAFWDFSAQMTILQQGLSCCSKQLTSKTLLFSIQMLVFAIADSKVLYSTSTLWWSLDSVSSDPQHELVCVQKCYYILHMKSLLSLNSFLCTQYKPRSSCWNPHWHLHLSTLLTAPCDITIHC